MARIPYFDLDHASPALRSLLAARRPLNIYRMVAHGGATAEGFLALGGAILRHSTLDATLRELVILRVGALSSASYEIHQHRRVARQAGVPQAKIEAVLANADGSPDYEAFSAMEMDVLRFVDAVVRQVKAPQHLFDAVVATMPPQQLVELMMTIGFYMLVSRFLETLEVDLEDSPVC